MSKNKPRMTRIRERAPANKFMENAQLPPSNIHSNPRRAIRTKQEATALEMQERLSNGPDVFDGTNAQTYERRNVEMVAEARRSAQQGRVEELEEDLAKADEDLIEANDQVVTLEEKVQLLESQLENSIASEAQTQTVLEEQQEAARLESQKVSKVGAELKEAQEKIEELEAKLEEGKEANAQVVSLEEKVQLLESQLEEGGEAEEVEVYPDKIVVQEVTNVSRKGSALIFRTNVRMDDELVPMTIRTPYKKMRAAIEKADRSATPTEEDEE